MAAIVWDRKAKVAYPRGGTFADSTEANAWIRRNKTKGGNKADDRQYDVITVSIQP